MTMVAPRAAAMLTATVIPRSLNEPVGLAPSTLRYTSQPVIAESTGAGSSGVPPSPSVITDPAPGDGSRSPYSPSSPRHRPAAAVTAAPVLATAGLAAVGPAARGGLIRLPRP